MTLRKPLDGFLVVALEQAVAAPYCTSRLADAGARVIKIERPGGDFARGYDTAARGQSSYFVWLNRGKESIVLDLSKNDDLGRLTQLLARADVFVQNLKPGALDRLGLSLGYLRSTYPSLICCSITGYGDEGPLSNRKAYDLMIQAESGLCSITGTTEPSRVGISVVDIATGAVAQASILEALLSRVKTSEGADIRISMFDVIADWMTVPLLNAESGNPPKRIGVAHPSIAPYGAFSTLDEKHILIAIQSEREWNVFCSDVLQNKGLLADDRLATNVERVRNRAHTDAVVGDGFSNLNWDELALRLQKAEIAFAELNDMDGLSKHPHLRRVNINTPEGDVLYPAPAPLFDGASRVANGVPAVGQDTARVFSELSRHFD